MLNIQKLKQHFEGDISTSVEDMAKHAYDASIFHIPPEVVLYPKTVADIQHVVEFVSAEKALNPELSITARSAGTDMGGGSVNDSIILDFTKYINKIIEVKEEQGSVRNFSHHHDRPIETAGYAITQPGVYYRDFEKETLKHNLIMPSYPASRGLCAMGGIMANNSGGEKSLSYGKTENYLETIWAVLADGKEYEFGPLTEPELEAKMRLSTYEGEIYRKIFHLIRANYDVLQKAKPSVSKNSAGYYLWNVWDKKTFNMSKLLVGSQGTLGLVTKGKFRLVTPHTKSKMLVMFLHDVAPLGSIVNEVMKHNPETFESFDDHTMSLAIKFLPAMIKKMASGSKGTGSFGGPLGLIKLGLEFLPEVWMTLTGGMPKLILIAEFTGDDEAELLRRAQETQKTVVEKFHLQTHITKNDQESQKYWTVRRESFSLLRERVKNLHSAPFIDDFAVHPADLPTFLPKLDAIFKKYPSLIYTIAGHAGDANFHIIPLMDLTKESERAIIPKLSDEVYDLIIEYKGTITAEHNDGLVRGPYLEKMYGPEVFNLFKEVKHVFDPNNIFNPHKKTDATEEYLIKHIRTD